MKRWVKICIGILVVLVVALLVAGLVLSSQLGGIVKRGAEAALPPLTGTTVEIGSVSLRPLSGGGSVSGIRIGNPEGFKTDAAFRLDGASLGVDLGSLTSETIIVRKIDIEGGEVTFEYALGARKSNLTAIQENIEAAVGPSGDTGADDASQTKVIIERFRLAGSSVRVSSTLAGGKAVTIPLPTIELTEIGRKSSGVTAAEAAQQIFAAIGAKVREAVAQSGKVKDILDEQVLERVRDFNPEGLKDAGGAVKDKVLNIFNRD
jgi:hypothetical protein